MRRRAARESLPNWASDSGEWTMRREMAKLRALIMKANKQVDLLTRRRGKAMRDDIHGKKVLAIAAKIEVARSAVNQWLRWYDTDGTETLWPHKALGSALRLTPAQHDEFTGLIEARSQAADYTSRMWTGPRIGDLIRRRFGVRYLNHHIPRLLHPLGFLVQRPRKRLARVAKATQELWPTKRPPATRRKAARCRGVGVFENEASFWQDGSLHRTWAWGEVQPRIDTYGLTRPRMCSARPPLTRRSSGSGSRRCSTAPRFFEFRRQLVARYDSRKVSLIIDNAPCHRLNEEGLRWLRENRHRIELHRMPAYLREFIAMKACGTTRKLRTRNTFFFTRTSATPS